jgi:hypothetical protein
VIEHDYSGLLTRAAELRNEYVSRCDPSGTHYVSRCPVHGDRMYPYEDSAVKDSKEHDKCALKYACLLEKRWPPPPPKSRKR